MLQKFMVTVYDGKSLRHKYQNIEDTEYSTERWELRSDQEQVENEMSIETLDRSDREVTGIALKFSTFERVVKERGSFMTHDYVEY